MFPVSNLSGFGRARSSAGIVRRCFCIGLVSFIPLAGRCSSEIAIIPSELILVGPESRQKLIVEEIRDGHFVGQMTNNVEIDSRNLAIASVKNGILLPVTNGVTIITAKVGKQTVSAKVTVKDMDKPFEWSFRNHVQPVLAKNGCSAGACHGAAAGQNGFKLSLRGYDDEGDYLTLTRAAQGRRIVPSDSGRSLVLLKPTTAVPHKGGKRFDTDSLDYRVIAEWIASGAPGPKTNDVRISKIEILPAHVVLKAGASQQLSVQAHFTDGHVEDVTRWTKYTSANETVAQIDDAGLVKVVGFGEGALTAWYLSRIDIATVTVPYTNQIPSKVFTQAKRRNFIDDIVLEKLRDLNLPPSPRCGDSEYLRRTYLDTIGVLPTAEETRKFLADKSSRKRDALVESLLRRPEFVDYWTYKWCDLLLVSSRQLRPTAMWAYYDWVRNNVAADTPWDVFVRKVVTAQGSTLQNGAANFYVLHDDPRVMAETTSQAFLGMSINCAKCHNHPMEKWTNKQYYQMANMFARVRTKNAAEDGDSVVFVADEGDVVQPLTGRAQSPAPLDAKPLSMDAPEDRRAYLADWLVSPTNHYFTRSIVNRVWANYMSVGLVESVDDMRDTNPASNEKLLSALAKYLAEQKYDLKSLMRLILQSETYQRASEPLPANAADTRFYSHHYPKRLMAEVLHDAVAQVTGVPTQFTLDRRNANAGLGEKYPLGLRAMQLPDTQTDSYFLKAFGRPEREKTCECERTAEPNVTQMLHLANGDTLNKKLEAKNNRISTLIAAKATDDKIVDDAYLSALSRYPLPDEKDKTLKVLQEAGEKERRPAIEDVYWAVLSSKEFLFDH